MYCTLGTLTKYCTLSRACDFQLSCFFGVRLTKYGENTLVLCIVIGGGEEEVIVSSELIDDTAKVDNAEDSRAEE